MTFDLTDFQVWLDDKHKALEAGRRHDLRMLAQAEVAADQLTGDPAWDLLLRHLQAAIEATERQRDDFRARLESPDVVDDESLRRAKAGLLLCEERIRAWRVVMEMPADIKRRGADARALLDRMGA